MTSPSNFPLVTITSRQTENSVSFIPATWTQDDRKDVLTFTEGTPEDKAAGTVSLEANVEKFPAGWYNVVIREQTNNTNLDPTDAVVLGVLDRGISYLTISGVAFGENTYIPYANEQDSYTFYQG